MPDDDPYKTEIKQEVMQDLQYRAHLAETQRQAAENQRQAEEYYFNSFPQHREAKSLVVDTAKEFLREHPEFDTSAQPREKIDEAVRTLGQRVNELLARASGQPSQESRWSGGREPSDAERREAIEEEVTAFEKKRRPPR